MEGWMSKFGTIKFDQALTNVSIAYKNGVYVAERIAPVVVVGKQTDKYFVYGKERFNVLDDKRVAGGVANESRWTPSSDTYYCDGHALKDYVPREDVVNADPQLDLLTDTTENLKAQILLNQEVNLVAALVAALTGTSLAAQTATHWDNDANDPIALIKAQRLVIAKRTGVNPNVFAVSEPVMSAIANNANVKARITGAQSLQSSLVTAQALAALLEVDEVIVASAVKNTANEGQDPTLDWVWGEDAYLFYRPPSPGRKVLSMAYTFVWSPFGNGTSEYVKRYWWEPNTADVCEVHKYYDLKAVAVDAGVRFSDCLT
jgi:hypothetical protein